MKRKKIVFPERTNQEGGAESTSLSTSLFNSMFILSFMSFLFKHGGHRVFHGGPQSFFLTFSHKAIFKNFVLLCAITPRTLWLIPPSTLIHFFQLQLILHQVIIRSIQID